MKGGSALPSSGQFKVLYIFAGMKRKSDLEECITLLCNSAGTSAVVECVDLIRGESEDILLPGVWNALLVRIKAAEFQAVVITPPCNTFSRARHSHSQGPPPVRSRVFPMGLPWLFGRHKQQVELANRFIEIMVEGFQEAQAAGALYLGEHPEDLGRATSGEVPASIWNFESVRNLPSLQTCATFQCPFGAVSSKATRFISNFTFYQPESPDEGAPHARFWTGWPQFDSKFRYTGPLPRVCGHSHPPQIGLESDGAAFKTSKLSAYPGKLCMWLAGNLFRTWRFSHQPKGGELTEVKLAEEPEEKPAGGSGVTEPAPERKQAAKMSRPPQSSQAPLETRWGGKTRQFHDGMNLQSPGRFHPNSRPKQEWDKAGAFLLQILGLVSKYIPRVDILCYQMATGKIEKNPFPEPLLEEGRAAWFRMLGEDSDLGAERISCKTEFQPFYLFAIGETLRLMGDQDHGIFFREKDSFATGVPVGYKEEILLVHSQYEERSKYRKYDESVEMESRENYKSATPEILKKQFAEEIELGHMFTLTVEEARLRWKTLRVAAQGALEKSETEFRIIHDGTHGVNINNEIRNPNLQRFPGVAEQKEIMLLSSSEHPGVHFGLQADVSKAHRRFLHRESDLGLLACTAEEGPLSESTILHINRVGTFGISTAAFWWGRLAAGIGRMVLNFLCLRFHWHWFLLYADDSRQQAAGAEKFLTLIVSLLLWTLAGTPFAWRKLRGGLKGDWLGFWIDYEKFEVGISEKRGLWLLKWAKRILSDRMVQISAMTEGLGRLCYVSGVVEYYRPFLSPMFAWVAAAPAGAVLPVPPMVLLVLDWIARELETGRLTTSHKVRPRSQGELFRTDTKAETDYVVLGGWKSEGGKRAEEAEWFSIRLTKEEVPWLFEKGHGSRTIAASELMATLVATHLFIPDYSDGQERTASFVASAVEGITDNKGNSYVVKKLLSTKLPLGAVVMQLASVLARKAVWLDLHWKPREENVLADDLTNEDFSKFSPELRRNVSWAEIPTDIMNRVNELATEFARELESRKRSRPAKHLTKSRKKRKDWRNVWGGEV